MRGRRLTRDVVVNLVFAAVKAGAYLWMIRLAGAVFAPAALGLFLLTRRVSSTGANLLQMGTSQTLLRYLSMNSSDPAVKRLYVSFALLLTLLVGGISLPLFYTFRGILARWIFPGAPGNEALAFWTGALLSAMILDFVARSPLIAERRMVQANLVELLNSSGFLILVLLWQSMNATPIGTLQAQAFAVAGLSLGVVLLYFTALRGASWPARRAQGAIFRSYIYYGLSRGLITFLDMGLLLIGPWLLRSEIDQAGFLIIALSMVQLLSVAISPVAQVALVVAARFVGTDDDASIREGVRLLFGSTLYGTLFLISTSLPWIRCLVRLWLKDPALTGGVLPYFMILVWGFLPFAVFQGLKGIIEARWVHPLNLYTLLLGAGLQVIVFQLLRNRTDPVVAIGLSILISFWTMGLLTMAWVRPYLRELALMGWGRLIFVAIILAMINAVLAGHPTPVRGILAAVLSTSIIAAFVFLFPTQFLLSCQTLIGLPRRQP